MTSHVLRLALGRAIRQTRARRGLSQEQLGFAAGLHRNYIGALERGESNATLRSVDKVARALDVTLAELFLLRDQHLPELQRELQDHRADTTTRRGEGR